MKNTQSSLFKRIYRYVLNKRIRGVIFKVRQKLSLIGTVISRKMPVPLEHYYSPFPVMKDIKKF